MNKINLFSEETKSQKFRTYSDTGSVKGSEHTSAGETSSPPHPQFCFQNAGPHRLSLKLLISKGKKIKDSSLEKQSR